MEPSRRSFIAGVGAAAAAPDLLPTGATALEDPAGMAYRTAGELVKALAERKISAREVLDTAITRIEALDPKINAVVVRDFDRARTAADAADAALARGERRPLLGLPMTVKEQFGVPGLPTTWDDPKFKDCKPEADALAVQRLKSAGAVILGKTNVPIRLQDWQSYNEVYATTNNPWDLGRSPGGSSGGGAAALAAGCVALEVGSDIGGSLCCPAHFCGIFSHKPSLDLVPQRGSGPPQTPAIPVRGDLAVIGPMARSAADLAFELNVLAGPDELMEGVGYKLALPPPRHERLADFRVLVIDAHPLLPTATSIIAALDGLADRLAKAGCQVVRQSPKLPDLALTSRIYRELRSAFFSADLAPEVRERVVPARCWGLQPIARDGWRAGPVDVIVTDTQKSAAIAHEATRTIPIVGATLGPDPVAAGLATSFTHPGAERKLSGKEEALLVATACSNPPEGRARWTLELLAGSPPASIRRLSQSVVTQNPA